MIGAPAPAGDVNVPCNPSDAALDLFDDVTEAGKLRNVRQAAVFRHRPSVDSLMVRRYVSKLLRRSSVSTGLVTVRVNHDFPGNEAGGAAPACVVKDWCSARKSENRFPTVKERSGRRRVIS